MSLEDKIDQLIEVIEDLTAVMVLATEEEVDASDVEYSTVTVDDDTMVGIISSRSPSEHPDWPNQPLADDEPVITPANQRTIELISLSKEMGFEYLLEGEHLAVDNRVIDEYNRRKLGDGM